MDLNSADTVGSCTLVGSPFLVVSPPHQPVRAVHCEKHTGNASL